MLTSRDDLKRTRPDFVPVLTPRGRGRLTLLPFFDGRRALSEVESEMLARHPDLFTSHADAAAFVAEVIAGYTKS